MEPVQKLLKLDDIQVRHGRVAIVYREEKNVLILQECQLRRQLFVPLFLCVPLQLVYRL